MLVQALNEWIDKGKIPDELSIEHDDNLKNNCNNDSVIYFRWFDTNKEKVFDYTEERYNVVWKRFNDFWNSPYGARLGEVRDSREQSYF